ncbi:MAG: hypothetical protein JW783_03265 [Bacteroidales bacterium]|nr:hypothetical protein [Bacteroidales bacterium]MBN2750996.1 hypothetical protein [Bacteroidales bacterium]
MKTPILDYELIKRDFREIFFSILNRDISFKMFLYDIFVHGTAYVVGGFLRDVILKKESRDLDIIVDLKHDLLISVIESAGLLYDINRHGGVKINFKNVVVDLWSIENNWAFRNNLVKINEDKMLESIAKGCFYNYDSLVINLHTMNMNIRYFSNFCETNELDILQKQSSYKILNPTIEANILRAFFLRKFYDVRYTVNTKVYLLNKIAEFKDVNSGPLEVLVTKKNQYPKYDEVLSVKDIKYYLLELINDNSIDRQFFLKI